ncbi:related to ribosomal protein L3 precursor, mitochondrial [Cephalotrichum gorgonifer]|uniref:Large ribosomal subunit protein uL3m n=1 Tax=Cephalotrichum gorgonifer TaxID=2041049 RepID=A0AAE8N304_9PEZI|nr:related to ribosomal protein L3 precursor, mitochondrial [Cephalotrichum gorgonifer]
MAPRLLVGASLALGARLPILPRTVAPLLLPRTAKRGVKYGWNTAPPRSKHNRFRQVTSGLPPLTTGPAAALARKEATTPPRTGVLAIKKGMSAVFKGKTRVPCTILQMDRVQVVAGRTRESNGYWAVQVGMGVKRPDNVTNALLGYFEAKGVAPKRHMAEFRVKGPDGLLPVGTELQPDWFAKGQYVDVRGNSRGMGFAGVMKRHGFAGQEASHGNSKNHRTMGTAGPSQGGGSRIHPGKKMPGRMGGNQATVQNLKVLKVDNELGIVIVHGAVPGPKGSVVKIQDAIKKRDLTPARRAAISKMVLERNPGLEQRLEEARKRHLELKEERAKVAFDRAIERQEQEAA